MQVQSVNGEAGARLLRTHGRRPSPCLKPCPRTPLPSTPPTSHPAGATSWLRVARSSRATSRPAGARIRECPPTRRMHQRGISLSLHVRPRPSVLCVRTTCTRLLRAVRTRGTGQLDLRRHALYVRRTRTSLGRAVRTMYRAWHHRSSSHAMPSSALTVSHRVRNAHAV